MISSEAIPVKEEPITTTTEDKKEENTVATNKVDEITSSEIAKEEKKSEKTTTSSSSSSDSSESTISGASELTEQEKEKEAAAEKVVTETARRKFNLQFQQRTKYLREMWSEQRVKINKDYSQFWCIIILCFISILASLASISTSNWTCGWTTASSFVQESKNDSIPTQEWEWATFGVWNTCNQQQTATPVNETFNFENNVNGTTNMNKQMDQDNVTISWAEQTWWCAKQDLGRIVMQVADQTRLDQVTAAQSLMSIGIVLYVFSLVCIVLGFRFLRSECANRMNRVRNALIISLVVQVFAFLMMLIGFFLFVYTDRLSISVVLLFVYFVFAIFATNLINFITIEYKAYKMRKAAC